MAVWVGALRLSRGDSRKRDRANGDGMPHYRDRKMRGLNGFSRAHSLKIGRVTVPNTVHLCALHGTLYSWQVDLKHVMEYLTGHLSTTVIPVSVDGKQVLPITYVNNGIC